MLLEAHKLRAERGDHNTDRIHLAVAPVALGTPSSDPYRDRDRSEDGGEFAPLNAASAAVVSVVLPSR